jgi:GAF domain-containing protein
MAAELCRVPIAAINLVDRDRQWSKAAVGQDKDQDIRDISFCAHAILGTELMVVPDAQKDQRFGDNPLVVGDPHIRFYAGAPLITSEGFALGSLCVVDRVPRQLTDEQAALLRLLADRWLGGSNSFGISPSRIG